MKSLKVFISDCADFFQIFVEVVIEHWVCVTRWIQILDGAVFTSHVINWGLAHKSEGGFNFDFYKTVWKMAAGSLEKCWEQLIDTLAWGREFLLGLSYSSKAAQGVLDRRGWDQCQQTILRERRQRTQKPSDWCWSAAAMFLVCKGQENFSDCCPTPSLVDPAALRSVFNIKDGLSLRTHSRHTQEKPSDILCYPPSPTAAVYQSIIQPVWVYCSICFSNPVCSFC